MSKKSPLKDKDVEDPDESTRSAEAIDEGKVFDYITGKPVKDSDS